MLLLGAGASVEAGVPHATRMTEEILRRFRERQDLQEYGHILSFAIGGLLFQSGIRDSNPFDGVNVEDVFNAVLLLSARHKLEAAPFVGSWHHMVDEFDRIRPRADHEKLIRAIYKAVVEALAAAIPSSRSTTADATVNKALRTSLEKAVKSPTSTLTGSSYLGAAVQDALQRFAKKWTDGAKQRPPSTFQTSEVGREFKRAIRGQQLQPGDGEVFGRTARHMISMLRGLVWIEDPDKVNYLSPLATLARRQERVTIATMNYDNAIELLCRQSGVHCATGIDEWSTRGRFSFAGAGINLIKLHGSIDWVRSDNVRTAERPLPHTRIEQLVSKEQAEDYFPAVIFGQKNKLTAEGPFLDLLRAFERALVGATILTVIGYSLRDAHINEYITRWLNADPGRRLRIVDPNFDSNQGEFAVMLRQYAADRIEVVQQYTGVALRRLYEDGPN
jgi:NAD-dependent SIR2 family protein deacetylase